MHGKRPFPKPQQLPELSFTKKQSSSFSASPGVGRSKPQLQSISRLVAWAFGWGLLEVGSGIAVLLRRQHHNGSLTMQLHDEEPGIPCTRFDACVDDCNDRSRPLILDLYCLMSRGYKFLRGEMHQAPLPSWHKRLRMASWRSATAGSYLIDLTNLERNCRYHSAFSVAAGLIASMPASTGLCNAAIQRPSMK